MIIKEQVPIDIYLVHLTGASVGTYSFFTYSFATMETGKQIRIAFEQAEKEVMDLRQRTREGIETAKLNGKQIGQALGLLRFRLLRVEPERE